MGLVIPGEFSASSYGMFLRKCTKSSLRLTAKVEEISLMAYLRKPQRLNSILY